MTQTARVGVELYIVVEVPWGTIERAPGGGGGGGGAWSSQKFKGGLGGWEKGLQRPARPIPHDVCPRRGPRAREVSERLYIHHPVSTGKGGVHKKGLHWPPALGVPHPKGMGWDGSVSNTCQTRRQADPMCQRLVPQAAARWTRSHANHH